MSTKQNLRLVETQVRINQLGREFVDFAANQSQIDKQRDEQLHNLTTVARMTDARMRKLNLLCSNNFQGLQTLVSGCLGGQIPVRCPPQVPQGQK